MIKLIKIHFKIDFKFNKINLKLKMYKFISQLSFAITPLGTLVVCNILSNQKWDMRNNAKSHPRPSYMQWKHFPR